MSEEQVKDVEAPGTIGSPEPKEEIVNPQTPDPEKEQPADDSKDDGETLLGKKEVEKVEETAEQKAEREKTEAENKKLLEADDKTLSKEQLAKKQELITAKLNTVPEKYEAKMPEGFEANQQMIDKLTPVLKKHNITQAAFQEIVNAYAPEIQAQVEAQRKEALDGFTKIVSDWKSESIKELGADYKTEVRAAAKFIDKYGDDQLRVDLEQTGLGNRISVIRAFAKAGKSISQDSFPDSSKKIPGEKSEQETLDILYPTMKK